MISETADLGEGLISPAPLAPTRPEPNRGTGRDSSALLAYDRRYAREGPGCDAVTGPLMDVDVRPSPALIRSRPHRTATTARPPAPGETPSCPACRSRQPS